MNRHSLLLLTIIIASVAFGLACGVLGTPGTPTAAPLPTTDRADVSQYIVEGSVELEDGRCCAGGVAGDTIQVIARFTATSSAAPVTEMRVRPGNTSFDESAMDAAPWQTMLREQTFPVTVVLNWTGFYVSVQFRDADGNLSPVVSDDISVEGSPPTPTPSP
mgnify:CR=1 FL=1